MVSLEYGLLTEVFKTNLISQKCSCNAITENNYNLGSKFTIPSLGFLIILPQI